ncbi:MAG: type II toxin-antitoxin system HicB family antitoxin [Alphaproteobacteria bacterium]|nr:type II toxin-antitoxin system HicB family antitoxin [Alphaproteobacteria bacterium]
MMRTYFAIVHKDPGSAYGLEFPDVPGCFGAGDTFEEAVKNARDALRLHLETAAELGRAPPHIRSFETLMADPEIRNLAADRPLVGISLLEELAPGE